MRLHAVGSRGNSTPFPSNGRPYRFRTKRWAHKRNKNEQTNVPELHFDEVYDGAVQRSADRTRLMPLLQRVAEQGSVSVTVHGLTSDDIIHVPEAHTEHKKQTTAAYSVIPHIIGVLF
jgi:hypothetical protein